MEFKLISIASIIAFYGCYFVKMFHQKKQGIQTDQIGKNKVGFVKFVEITMKIAAILVFIAGLSSIFFETEHNPVSVRIFGAILSVAGTAIFIVAVWTMRDSWRAGVSKTDKTELVTNGIYQISRNPAFLPYEIKSPSLLICGTKDHAGSCIRYNREWHRKTKIPLKWIEGAGHNSNTDKPDMINSLLEEFFSNIL